MAANSKIEWTHHTFNPWRGCTKVSEGCRHCYADALSARNPAVLGQWGPNGTRVVAAEATWREPLKWDIAAGASRERHRVFCASLADVFEGDDTMPYAARAGVHLARERLFGLIRRTRNLDWLLLTKRPENFRDMLPWGKAGPGPWGGYRPSPGAEPIPLTTPAWPNVWLGVSVENQQAADERIPHLMSVPVAARFLSCEPLLGPLELGAVGPLRWDVLRGWKPAHGDYPQGANTDRIDWVIAGGESGPDARPMHPDWARSLRDQCATAGVAFHFKQWGEYLHVHPAEIDAGKPLELLAPGGRVRAMRHPSDAGGGEIVVQRVGKKAAGRLLDGREWDELPSRRPV